MVAVEIISEIPNYTGPGVYSLTDQNGKKYIGSSRNVKARIKKHLMNFNRIIAGDAKSSCNEGKKLTEAVLSGMTFKAELIQKLPAMGTFYDLMNLEKTELERAGGCCFTYNSMPIKDYKESDYWLLHYWEESTQKKAATVVSNLEQMISKREKPIIELRE